MKYRADIDGLRAIAVVPVVLFHADLGLLPGGFIGVDVFFVISGFLITGIIMEDVRNGTFSIAGFYERRVRRILPALLGVALAVMAGGFIWFLPWQLVDLGYSSLATLVFGSNVWFWRTTSYFDPGVAIKPLLHTWSLAVEEQFYIFFPLLIATISRLLPASLRLIVIGILGLSLALSIAGMFFQPVAAFYLLPTRAWELMIGAALALGLVPVVRAATASEALAACGLLGVACSAIFYSDTTPFPGFAALLPALGTAAVIHGGASTQVARILQWRPLVFVGLVSYPLYLWHWPVFVFLRQVAIETKLPTMPAILGIVAAFVLAVLSWRFLEKPFRDRSRMTRRQVYVTSAIGAGIVAAMAVMAIVNEGFPARFAPQVVAISEGRQGFSVPGARCLNDPLGCGLGADERPTFLVWGDSHAASLHSALAVAGRTAGRAGTAILTDSCAPVATGGFGPARAEQARRCALANQRVWERLAKDGSIDLVVLSASWPIYAADPDFVPALRSTIRQLRLMGKRVVVLTDIPLPGFNVPWTLALSLHAAAKPPAVLPTEDFAKQLDGAGAILLSLSRALCAAECPLLLNGESVFSDTNHLSDRAALTLVAPFLVKQGVLAPELLPAR